MRLRFTFLLRGALFAGLGLARKAFKIPACSLRSGWCWPPAAIQGHFSIIFRRWWKTIPP